MSEEYEVIHEYEIHNTEIDADHTIAIKDKNVWFLSREYSKSKNSLLFSSFKLDTKDALEMAHAIIDKLGDK